MLELDFLYESLVYTWVSHPDLWPRFFSPKLCYTRLTVSSLPVRIHKTLTPSISSNNIVLQKEKTNKLGSQYSCIPPNRLCYENAPHLFPLTSTQYGGVFREARPHRLATDFLNSSVQFSSVAQLCLTLCDPMKHSTPGLPVHHQLPEFTRTHAHQVGDAIQPSHPLSSPSLPAPSPSQHQGLLQ